MLRMRNIKIFRLAIATLAIILFKQIEFEALKKLFVNDDTKPDDYDFQIHISKIGRKN